MINPLFEVHMLNEQGKGLAKSLAGEFHGSLCSIEGMCGTGEAGRGLLFRQESDGKQEGQSAIKAALDADREQPREYRHLTWRAEQERK
jgi:hypothetical protein